MDAFFAANFQKGGISVAQQPAFNDYYYGNEADQYTFYRLPKALFTDNRYKTYQMERKYCTALCLTAWDCQ